MKKVYIVAGETLNNVADNVTDLLRKAGHDEIQIRTSPYKYQHSVDRKELSGIDSYSRFVLHPLHNLIRKTPFFEANEKIGTVFASEFGPMNSNMKVLRELFYECAGSVSPKKFAGTVSNTCLGHICMRYGFKGISTMFVGSSPLPYAYRVLQIGRGNSTFIGSLDEYNEDFYADFENHTEFKYGKAEGANALYLINEDLADNYKPGFLVELLSVANIVGGDLNYRADALSMDENFFMRGTRKAIEKANIRGEEIDEIYTISNSDPDMEKLEDGAMDQVLPWAEKIKFNKLSKTGFLVASLQNLAIACESLKAEKAEKTVLVNGISACGQFTAAVIRGEKVGK